MAAFVIFAPAEHFTPRKAPVPNLSSEAIQLATLWVEPHHRQSGFGRLLLQEAIKEAVRRDAPAVEAYGDRRWREGACVLPATWLLHEGFQLHREHPRYPLLRLDTKRTVRWAESLEAAMDEILERLPVGQPRRAPIPHRIEEQELTPRSGTR